LEEIWKYGTHLDWALRDYEEEIVRLPQDQFKLVGQSISQRCDRIIASRHSRRR